MSTRVVVISSDVGTPLQSIILHEEKNNNERESQESQEAAVETVVRDALNISLDTDAASFGDVVCKTLLVRSTITTTYTDDHDGRRQVTVTTIPGLHAYHFHHRHRHRHQYTTMKTKTAVNNNMKPNIRATRLAMALGLYRIRLYGTVVLIRQELLNSNSSSTRLPEAEEDTVTLSSSLLLDHVVSAACNVTPDLRRCILQELLQQGGCANDNDNDTATLSSLQQPTVQLVAATVPVPDWIGNAAMNSYHDEDALSQLAAVMKRNNNNLAQQQQQQQQENDDDDETKKKDCANNIICARRCHDDRGDGVVLHDKEKPVDIGTTNDGANNNDNSSSSSSSSSSSTSTSDEYAAVNRRPAAAVLQPRRCQRRRAFFFVAKSPLCFHCQGPAKSLCPDCHAVYFCDLPRTCRSECWSHDCQCQTWRLYQRRRTILSTLPLGSWHRQLMSRDSQLSPLPYKDFLVETLKVIQDQREEATREEDIVNSHISWWMTELDHGWSGGQSDGAKTIDVETRCSYRQGFHPIVDFPPDRPASDEELEQCSSYCKRNQVGWLCLQSWRDYYKLRGIAESSPVALLLTFPLTLYYSITEYGQVPCTVALMLKRPLRIHVVGVEKELKLLDLFKEIAYLMPPDFSLELVFIVRDDMLPESLKKKKDLQQADSKGIVVKLCDNLCVYIVSGTYADSMDPNFDCGTGAPDIVMAFNAGLYAYASWRSVIRFLDVHRGVVGIFTDYNEYSGLGCASLGGAKSRESLCMNSFRQPRAMPVYSMNLPQFCNGFLYVFNQQELD